jgi:hypothetical protein
VCAERDHTSPRLCPLHGCPDCTIENSHWDGVDVPGEIFWQLEELCDEYLDVDADVCELCTEIRDRAALVRYPGWRCELSDCLRCEVCEAKCMESGEVCRNCRRCMTCAEADGECGVPRWDPQLRREVWVAHHETYDPKTGRWG